MNRASNTSSPRRRPRLALIAALSGVLVGAAPLMATAAAPPPQDSAGNTWLQVGVKGADSATTGTEAGLPGGGQSIYFFQRPASGKSSAASRELTFSVRGEAVASWSALFTGGEMAQTEGCALESSYKNGVTTITVESTDEAQQLYVLPKSAPKAADPADQEEAEGLWHKLLNLLPGVGDDDDSDASTCSAKPTKAGDSQDSAKDDDKAGSDGSAAQDSSDATEEASSTASPTTEPDDAAGEQDENSSSAATPTTSPSASSSTDTGGVGSSEGNSPSDSPSNSPDQQCLATAGPAEESSPDSNTSSAADRSPQDTATSDRDPSSGPTGPATQPTTSPSSTTRDSALSKACDEPSSAAPAPTSSGDSADEGDTSKPSSASGDIRMQSDVSGLPFMLGAAGEGVANGAYAQALGRDVDIAATWANDNANMVALPQLQKGGEYGDWKKSIDISIGAIEQNQGESWAKAADGAYDDRWIQSLQNMRELRADAEGTTYIRFAHEWNGSWFAWSVNVGDTDNFKAAWKRYAGLAEKYFPEAKLVMSQNRESNGYAGNWTDAFPGNEYVDVLNVDYYNNWPYASTLAEFEGDLDEKDGYGGPKGLRAHTDFAAEKDLPESLGEWSGVQGDEGGDSPAFIEGMWNFFNEHAGTGPGDILYACQFEVSSAGGGKFNLLLSSQQPKAGEEYKKLFGSAS